MDLWEVWKVKLYGLSPWLEIQGMALWLGVREMVSLVSSVTQGECRVSYVLLKICYVYVHVNLAPPTFVGVWSVA